MPKKKLTNLLLYRRRSLIAYVFIGASLVSLTLIALLIPYGITPSEKLSVVHATTGSLLGVNAPYYALQKLVLAVLGFSPLTIKLPSIICGVILAIVLFLLLKRWLSLSIAVFGALMIFSSTTFLSLVSTGSPQIMYVLFPALLIFFGTRVLAHDRGIIPFTLLLLITVSFALLTPTMIYLVVLALGLALFNPHVRYGFRRLPLTGLVLLGCGTVIAVAPLAYISVMDHTVLRDVLAIPTVFSFKGVITNATTILQLFGSFLHPRLIAGMVAPIVGLATAGLAVLGLYRVIRAAYTARAQFIIGWGIIAVVLSLIDSGLGITLFLPVVLLASIGLGQLASIWYRTFPRNPYARIVALVPIGVLILGIVYGSVLRYANTTLYAKGSASLYSHDAEIIRGAGLSLAYSAPLTLAVTDDDVDFYAGLSKDGMLDKKAVARVVPLSQAARVDGPVITSGVVPEKGQPRTILTDARRTDSDHFYVYK